MDDWEPFAERMVARLVERYPDSAAAVHESLRRVPRHLFVPGHDWRKAYSGQVIVTKRDGDLPVSSASQVDVVLTMLDALDPRPGQRVLEIGAGTGYNAALLADLVGPDGTVVTVDIDEAICRQARTNLRRAGYEGVEVVCGDGALGFVDRAPYDRMIVTAGASDLSPHWTGQLRAGGLVSVPLRFRSVPCTITFAWTGARLFSHSILHAGFVPMRGRFARQERAVRLSGNWTLVTEPGRRVAVSTLQRLLRQRPRRDSWRHHMRSEDWPWFRLYLAWQEPRLILLRGRVIERGAFGLLDPEAGSLALMMPGRGGSTPREIWWWGAGTMAKAVQHHEAAWRRFGSPKGGAWQVTAGVRGDPFHDDADFTYDGPRFRYEFRLLHPGGA